MNEKLHNSKDAQAYSVTCSNRLGSPGDESFALPPTSLILCSRNRPVMLSDVVRSILDGYERPSEIIIVDDSDSPNEQLMTFISDGRCEIRYRFNKSRGLGRANNTGVDLARHDVLVFTQDDMLVSRTWFGTIVRALLKAGSRTLVTGQVRPGEPETVTGFSPSTVSDEMMRVYAGRIARDVVYFQNVAFYRSLFAGVGGFDPALGPGTRFPSAEDNDFGFRLLEAGYRILYEPRAVTFHRAWRSDKDYLELEWNYGRGQGAFYAKHVSLRDLYILKRFAFDAAGHLARLPLKLIHDRRQMCGSIVYLGGMLLGALEWATRRVLSSSRASGLRN